MDTAITAIAEWMPRQRWYGGKGHSPHLRAIGAWELPSAESGARAVSLLLMDDAPTPPILYQVPVVERQSPSAAPEASDHLIATLDDGTLLYDGPYDRVFTDALLAMIVDERTAISEGADAAGHYSGAEAGLARPPLSSPATVIGGEQSNTSIIYRPEGAAPVICKVYRQLHDGDNPDVTLQTALATSGSPFVPASVGDIAGEWDDVGQPTGRARGHLAFAQEFLPGVEDAWRVALLAAAGGASFVDEARELGTAVARVHIALAELFEREKPSTALIEGTTSAWNRRLTIAVAEVPELEPHRAAIEAFYARAESGAWPELQRIHGDLHLGQVISVPGRGWMLLDFEGEPLRPMSERRRPDLPVRDVAGMLRSFDYVAGSIALAHPDRADGASSWARAARQGFLDGYVATVRFDVRRYRDLLAAFELDKAVYEAIYEARNRPTWAAIPLNAIMHLLETGPLEPSESAVGPHADESVAN